jgi:hypothetical protein
MYKDRSEVGMAGAKKGDLPCDKAPLNFCVTADQAWP